MNNDHTFPADFLRELQTIRRELGMRSVPENVESIFYRLKPLTFDLTHMSPILSKGTRLFRVRQLQDKPEHIRNVGAPAPQPGFPKIGRLNDAGQSVLYLSDSPETAFAESRSAIGQFCLSEWKVTAEKLAAAYGGLSAAMLKQHGFTKNIYEGDQPLPPPTEKDEAICELFREIYTLDVGEDSALYRWSIACGMACGFAHELHRN